MNTNCCCVMFQLKHIYKLVALFSAPRACHIHLFLPTRFIVFLLNWNYCFIASGKQGTRLKNLIRLAFMAEIIKIFIWILLHIIKAHPNSFFSHSGRKWDGKQKQESDMLTLALVVRTFDLCTIQTTKYSDWIEKTSLYELISNYDDSWLILTIIC